MTWVFTQEQLAKWRIRKAPEGVEPPWRLADLREDVPLPGRWWVFPPKARTPVAACSSWDIAMRNVVDALIVGQLQQNPEVARLLDLHLPGQRFDQ